MDDNKKSQPTLLVIILMLLGLSAVPRGTGVDNSAPKAADTKSAESDEHDSEPGGLVDAPRKLLNPDLAVLQPLIDLSDDGSLRRIEEWQDSPKFDARGRKAIVKELVERAHQRRGTIQAMIALVPDPMRTSVSSDYDSQIEGIQRAAEAAGFVLSRFRFPWRETRKADKSRHDQDQDDDPDSATAESTPAAKAAVEAMPSSKRRSSAPPPRLEEQPGLLVFRHRSEKILIVFLVRETPTFGLRKHQLNWSLHLLDAFADAQPEWPKKDDRRLFCILGPRYTGTQLSLNQVIDGWLTKCPSEKLPGDSPFPPLYQRSYHFSIAASATEIDGEPLKILRAVKSCANIPRWIHADNLHVPATPKAPKITYRSASNRRRDNTRALITFLNGLPGSQKKKIALLVESNTALGRSISQNAINPSGGVDFGSAYINVYHYPLHIGSLRSSYEKQGQLRDPTGQIFRSAGRLELPPEEADRRRDIVSAETPDFSTRVDELLMVQLMTDIARGISQERYDAVGVAGSSTRDVIFLAQLVRKYSPDALLFSSTADLLYTQPQTISQLRGMLVGSPYSLYAPNRLWSYPYGAGPDVYFKDAGFQATYNAAMSLFTEIYEKEKEHERHKLQSLAYPLELGLPFEAEKKDPRPPIWISVVGNRGIYPLDVQAVGETDNRLDPWPTPPNVMDESGHPTQKSNVPEFLFHPSYHPFWKVLERILLGLGMILLGLAALELWWVIAKINRWDLSRFRVWKLLARPASFFVWSRAWNSARAEHERGAPHSSSGHGPGFLLVLAHLAFFLVFLSLNWPFLVPPPRPWGVNSGDSHWRLLAMVGLAISLLSLGLSIAAWCLLAIEKRAIGSLALSSLAVLGLAIFTVSSLRYLGNHSPIRNFLTLERIVTVTSGVSPTLPMLFVGLGAASFLVAQLKRVYLSEQFSIKNLAPKRGDERVGATADPLTNVEQKIDELAGVFRKPLRVFRLGDLAPVALLAIYVVLILLLWVSQSKEGSLGEGAFFNLVFWSFFAVVSVGIAFHVCAVHVIWSHVKQLLAWVSRLPLTRSFDRMPSRLERWFYESPSPQNRSMMIELQATALAERSGPSRVRAILENALSTELRQEDWDSLPKKLGQIYDPRPTEDRRRTWNEANPWLPRVRRFLKDPSGKMSIRLAKPEVTDPQKTEATQARVDLSGYDENTVFGANAVLKKILIHFWKGTPPTWTLAQTSAVDRAAEKARAIWPISPGTLQSVTGNVEVPEEDVVAEVRAWTEMAEDLITMQLLRHLSQFVAQLRVMVTFIVIGVFTLLLAINSYPFPTQNRTEFLLTMLIAVAAAVILRVIVGINRDETISRIANTASGLKLDRNLFTAFIGYILPLVGILAAASYDVSDLLRVWLEPVFRLFM